MENRKIYLDIIRVLACLMVIAMHSPMSGVKASLNGPFLAALTYFTAPCVPLFFMVSGALLLPCKNNIEAKAYLKKRVSKIVFPTLFFSIFYISIHYNEVTENNSIFQVLFSIPFNRQGHGVLWFMYTLLGLYLLIPIISPWLRNASKKEIEFYLLIWSITLFYPYLGKVLDLNTSVYGILYYFSGFMGYFILGYYLNRYNLQISILFPLGLIMLPLPLIDRLFELNMDELGGFWYLSATVAIMSTAWFVFCKNKLNNIKWGG